ncbi:FAD-dependent oxidoreductase [Bradyrhizobium jicamae]|uniref:oxidoreductase n=1 Tax=Bradyrhizobium jicamae TaxID=280332 RepID=UPI001BA57EE0|nr:FAD-dependent oxidoreductase [Bradyrhizobium jicamae]MBR0934125.1 FAD-dependent oxidoreductase [Bradyrhizobium jicamae]
MTAYKRLFSSWAIRNTAIKNRVVFPPTCPTWVHGGVLTDMATNYYRERARGGVGLIIIGATHVHPTSLAAPLQTPQLFNDANIEPLKKIADVVHAEGAKLAIQLWHSGVRGTPAPKMQPEADFDNTWYSLSPSQVPLGEYPGGITPKAMDEGEIEEIIAAYGTAAQRAIAAGLDGVEFHMSHGYLPWQFLSPLYNKRTDRWGGSFENRLRFPVEAMGAIRKAIGSAPFMGYRINSTSFWPGDLELEDVLKIVPALESQADLDYVSVSAGVHHTFIHTPMHFEGGWERDLAGSIRKVSNKPVLLVGRITTPQVAEELLAAGSGDAICLARQLFTDPEWANKAREGREDDIRRCVAANLCWKQAATGQRVQCVYNPTIGREGAWGEGTLIRVAKPQKIVVIGGGPAGLEYGRVAAARGHEVVLYEKEAETGGHVRLQSLLPDRSEFNSIATWLSGQAQKNGAVIKRGVEITGDNIDDIISAEKPGHVVVATGASVCVDGFQGWTGAALPGWESANCVGWDAIVTGQVKPRGEVLVIDDISNAIAPLTAVKMRLQGVDTVRMVSRWPMIGMDTLYDVYHDWILPKIFETNVESIVNHAVASIDGNKVTIQNVHFGKQTRTVRADTIVMVTGRRSENALHGLLMERGISVETIGDAVAPRGTYEAVYEGHRAGRRL